VASVVSNAPSATRYEPPALLVLGTLQELTLGCDKELGSTDGFTFLGQDIVCTSG
jgi:hypothetical protein